MEFHLTLIDNKPNDCRIVQGATYELPIIYPADISSYVISAQIRKTANDANTLAIFNTKIPIYDPLYEIKDNKDNVISTGATLFTIYLTHQQTSALPIPSSKRDQKDARPGINCWVWDCEALNEIEDTIIKIVSYSWVEVIPEVTR
jgi:hypothetical protein